MKLLRLLTFIFTVLFLEQGFAAAPPVVIEGPIWVDQFPSRNAIYSASALDLAANGYTEEEFFIAGTGNIYSQPHLATGLVESSGHPFKTRLIVRRPPPQAFNGVVVVEWINVTGGPDKDIDWWQSGEHLMRSGYAYVAVSAQQMGIDTMADWGSVRYGGLDMTADGTVDNDALSFDAFSAVGRVILRRGEESGPGTADILDGLRAEQIVATGHSQSAARLAAYINSIHPLEPIFDGFMVHGGGGLIRDDQPVKIFKLMAETDMQWQAAEPQPDSDNFRQWEVAGSSHVDVPFEMEYAKARNLMAGLPLENVLPREPDCELPPYSTVPFRDVMNAAFEHLVNWIRDETPPPIAPRLQVAQALPSVKFARDRFGNVLGGIRLAEHAVPTAKNTGMNSGTGSSRFCFLYGSHEAFSEAQLRSLYSSREEYVQSVTRVVQENLTDGYILPYAAERTIEDARVRDIGR